MHTPTGESLMELQDTTKLEVITTERALTQRNRWLGRSPGWCLGDQLACNKGGYSLLKPCISSSAMFLLILFTSYFVYQQNLGSIQNSLFRNFMAPHHKEFSPPAPLLELVQALRSASQAAGSKRFTAAELQKWHSEYPCQSRGELNAQYKERRHKTGNHIFPTSHFLTALQEYEVLHRTCIQKAGDLTQFFLQKTTIPGCKFVVAKGSTGLGNRVLWAISTLLYAILSQRVLIIDPRFFIPSLMCEPFPGSSWAATLDFPFMDIAPELWITCNDFLKYVDNFLGNGSASRKNDYYAVQADDDWGPHGRFYCNTEQGILSNVTWISLGGCLYFLPQLFAIPRFGPVLEILFPDKVPITHLLRYAMLPSDTIWARVKRVQGTYLQGADNMLGIHLRYMGGTQEYDELHEVVNSRVLRCANENNMLPNTSSDQNSKDYHNPRKNGPRPSSTPQHRVVFIASVYGSLRNTLSKLYPLQPSSSGQLVGVVQLSQEGGQHVPNYDSDSEAFAEILCLSISDSLITTPVSTFSELAQGYGALTPHLVDFENKNWPHGCFTGNTFDGCYQGAPDTYNCPFDTNVHHQLVTNFVPALEPCQSGVHGFQLRQPR